MKIDPTIKDTLFLHMGPGFNSYVERSLLGPQMEHIDFWDQPSVDGAPSSFENLVNQVSKKVVQMSDTLERPINIIAHSFGGQLLEQLLHQNPERIAKGTIYNSCSDLRRGLTQVLEKLKSDVSTSNALQNEIDLFLQTDTQSLPAEDFVVKCATLLSQDPLYIRLYFSDQQQLQKYLGFAVEAPPIDANTFISVLIDYLSHYANTNLSFNGNHEIYIYLSSDDPFHLNDSVVTWKNRFPKSNIKLNSTGGHFLHLEPHL